MSYCVDIVVPSYDPREDGIHAHPTYQGIPGRCVMTGCHTKSADESARGGIKIASAECGYAHYPIVYVDVVELCDACGGNGRVSKRRGRKVVPYAWLDCKACKGCGSWSTGQVFTVVNGEC